MTNEDALIGHTGFVGSTLASQRRFASHFNSATIGEIDGRSFDEVICAGVSAVKWWANQNEAEDRSRIEGLMRHLATIRAGRFVLISTIDVYRDPQEVDEADIPGRDGLHAYGRNRLMLEDFVRERFADHLIVRLPALFGAGLKKNALYDLMHNNRLGVINPRSLFQWYPLDRLSADLERLREARLCVLNMATEPVSMEEIRTSFFPTRAIGAEAAPAARYDMRTRHAALFGGSGPYMMRRPTVLHTIGRFTTAALAA